MKKLCPGKYSGIAAVSIAAARAEKQRIYIPTAFEQTKCRSAGLKTESSMNVKKIYTKPRGL